MKEISKSWVFLTFSLLVANPKKTLFYTVANPARGLLKRTKEKVWQHTLPPPPRPTLFVRRSGTQSDAGEKPACLKKNQNAPRPSEHPSVRRGKMSKRLGGIKGCKYKISSWQTGSPMEITLGQQYNVGEKPTVILYTYINRHAGTPEKHKKTNQKQCTK